MRQYSVTKIIHLFIGLFSFYNVVSQITFTDKTGHYLSQHTRSTLTMGFVDVNGDHFDDLITLDEGNRIVVGMYQGEGLPLKFISSDQEISFFEEWSFGVGDLDGDGMCEVLSAGLFNGVKVYKYDSLTNAFKLNHKINTNSYGQGCNMVDLNIDGHLDFFLSNDQGESRTLINNGNGILVNTPGLIDFSTSPVSDMSGNYGSEWVDVDGDGVLELFMAKCSQFAPEAIDPRRINQLYKKMDDGIYRDIAPSVGLDDGAQTWTSVFEDLDNDGDLDLVTANHYEAHKIYENQNGIFVGHPFPKEEDIFSFQVLGADFDNDGLMDLYYAGVSDYILRNKGDFEFEVIDNPLDGFKVHAVSCGDINRDGVIDVFAGYGQPIIDPGDRIDAIWTGGQNDNRFISISLEGITSNRQGIGSKIKIFGDWGIQQRNIRGGQGYSLVNSRNAHFGLGQSQQVDSVIIEWPNGGVQKFFDLPSNMHYLVEENGCLKSFYEWSNAEELLCPGSEITVDDALNLVSVQWSNQVSGLSHTVLGEENHFFKGYDSEGCLIQSEFFDDIIRIDESRAVISMQDTMFLCLGTEIGIDQANPGSLIWSTGDTTNYIVPTENNDLWVMITDDCGNQIIDTTYVNLVDPDFVLDNDTVKLGEDLEIYIPGEEVYWYADAISDDYIYKGNQLILNELQEDTSFYIERIVHIPIDSIRITGDRLEEDQYTGDHLNFTMLFDLFQDANLHQVTVYTDTAGEREFLIYNQKEELIFSKKVFVDTGKNQIVFDVFLEKGNDYGLKTNSEINLQNFGYEGPRFQISGSENIFPIKNERLISLNGVRGVQGYYFFYDWILSPARELCRSERVRKDIIVRLSDNTRDFLSTSIKLFPNPTQDILNVKSADPGFYEIQIFDGKGKLFYSQNFTQELRMETVGFHPGMYTIRIIENGNAKVLKWIKL